ncbi:AbrB/MazE/SpoVT family DNA-binding domain-containing protein [Priestia megaterium]|uniref:AbrB/MazE/SpoVT family DNA-binding domain-containing protein n=1 Tax=Priestia megaterium TaxID=1404 RepID=UPI002ABE4C1A|nr:AbrB/MazE/SpoVT family DNA-binding domain-containing protein [Priestia megaterium]
MKTTGIVRRVDELGRIVIPKELRRILGIEDNKTHLEIFTEEGTIILQKYRVGRVYAITDKVSNENRVYKENIVLSPEGKEGLFE